MTQLKTNVTNSRYAEAVVNLWSAAEDMFTYSQEPVKELYRLSSILGFIARQANKVESLRDELAMATETRDVGDLRRLKMKAEHMSEEKAFEACWSYCAGSYDKIRESVLSTVTNQGFVQETKSSQEILDSVKDHVVVKSKKEIDNLIELIKAEIDF